MWPEVTCLQARNRGLRLPIAPAVRTHDPRIVIDGETNDGPLSRHAALVCWGPALSPLEPALIELTCGGLTRGHQAVNELLAQLAEHDALVRPE